MFYFVFNFWALPAVAAAVSPRDALCGFQASAGLCRKQIKRACVVISWANSFPKRNGEKVKEERKKKNEVMRRKQFPLKPFLNTEKMMCNK
jgi:hypothetical protein